jgi:hypothetical protein
MVCLILLYFDENYLLLLTGETRNTTPNPDVSDTLSSADSK